MEKIYTERSQLDRNIALSFFDIILEAVTFVIIIKLGLLVDKQRNEYCPEDFCLKFDEDKCTLCERTKHELYTKWWWVMASGSMFFCIWFSAIQLYRMLRYLDYSDPAYYRDQMTFDEIITSDRYFSF